MSVQADGDPMLAQGLATTRDALLSSIDPATHPSLAQRAILRGATDELPEPGLASHLDNQGASERAASVLFEVIGQLSFEAGKAPLDAKLIADGEPLIEVTRPKAAYFAAELDRIQAQAPLRASRAAEILTQLASPYAYFASMLNLQPGRHAHTLELLQVTLDIANMVCQRFKVALAAPRPSEYSTQIQPMIDIPPHASFPAGHALQAHAIARLLARLTQADEQQQGLLRTLADRISENRIVAGVHFPVDCRFGRLIGDCLASWLLSACGQGEASSFAWRGGIFDGAGLTTASDFPYSKAPFEDSAADATRSPAAAKLPLYAHLWKRAEPEWPAPRPAVAQVQQVPQK